MSHEQRAFLNKYGMRIENAASQVPQEFDGTKWKYLKVGEEGRIEV